MVNFVVGIDEVGRGPLAGPVAVAVFCIERSKHDIHLQKGLKNSKALSPKSREELSRKLHNLKRIGEVEFVITTVSERVIDKKGIVYAIHYAIAKSLKKLNISPAGVEVLLDGGIKAPAEYIYQKTIIKGDEKHTVIAAASIVAKVYRDKLMAKLAKKYPEYGFERNKGYGTREHYKALKKHGPSKIHRKTFL